MAVVDMRAISDLLVIASHRFSAGTIPTAVELAQENVILIMSHHNWSREKLLQSNQGRQM